MGPLRLLFIACEHRAAHFFAVALASAAMGMLPSRASALLVDDRWQDTNRTQPASPTYAENNGTTGADSDADGDIESAWFYGGSGANGSLSVVAPGGGAAINGSPNNLRLAFANSGITSAISASTHFTAAGTPVTLANAGEKLTVTWTFVPTTVNATNGSQNMRIALVNWPEPPGTDTTARFTTDGSSSNPASGAFTGYAMFLNFAQTTGRATPYQLLERNVATGDMLSAGGNWASRADAVGFGNTAVGYFSGVEYTFTFSAERNATNGLILTSTMSGGAGAQALNGTGSVSVTFTDTSPNTFVFDTVTLRPSGATTTAAIFDTVRFQVDFVPEASPLLLVGVVGAGSIACRRLRRRSST